MPPKTAREIRRSKSPSSSGAFVTWTPPRVSPALPPHSPSGRSWARVKVSGSWSNRKRYLGSQRAVNGRVACPDHSVDRREPLFGCCSLGLVRSTRRLLQSFDVLVLILSVSGQGAVEGHRTGLVQLGNRE